MGPKPDDPVLAFATGADFEHWLAKHHGKAAVVWLKFAKKGSGHQSITMTEAVDVALCYGWIDGQSKALDAHHYLQRFTPRRAASNWSKINRDRVARLMRDSRMRPAGLAEVDRAKADGRWEVAYDSPKSAVVPDDLARALERCPKAKAAFARFKATDRYAVLHRLMIAKQRQTRTRQIESFVTKLEASETNGPAKAESVTQASGGEARPRTVKRVPER